MLLFLFACETGDSAAPKDTAGPVTDDAGGLAFVDETEPWGLGAANASAAWTPDLDGDGWPDLVTADNNGLDEDLSDAHYHHLWMNRDDGAGNRVFVDQTEESGLFARRDGDGGRPSAEQLFVDVDGDGDLDCFAGVFNDPHTDPTTHFSDLSDVLLNDGTGHFSFAPVSADLQVDMPVIGVTFNDYDADGNVDVYLGLWYANEDVYGDGSWLNWIFGANDRLLLGNGDGTFHDASEASGIQLRDGTGWGVTDTVLDGRHARPDMGSTSCDLDGDALPDVLAQAYGRQWNLQWKNLGGATFSEVGQASGYAGDADIDYTDNWYYTCYCWANGLCDEPTDPDFPYTKSQCTTVANGGYWNPGWDDQPANLNGNTFSTACADLDNDGDMDLLNAEITHQWAGGSSDMSDVLVNDGTGTFTRLDRAAAGTERDPVVDPSTGAWDFGDQTAAIADLDNDGRKDLVLPSGAAYYGNFLYVWRQWDTLQFYEAEHDAGLEVPTARGIAMADFDRDGDLDMVVTSLSELVGDSDSDHRLYFFRNDSPAQAWLRVHLVGPGTNGQGIGAKVSVTTGERTQVVEVNGGYGQHGLQMEPIASFGLGLAEHVDEVSVTWPGGEVTDYGSFDAGQQLVLGYDGSVGTE